MASKRLFVAALASGVVSATVDFGSNASEDYRRVYCNNEAAHEVALEGSGDNSNFWPIKIQSSAANVWVTAIVGSAHSGSYVELPPLPQYVKVVATAAVANGGAKVYFTTA